MNKVNDLYGKKVINQANGEGVAAVRDVVLSDDAQRIVALVVGGGAFSSDEQVIRWDKLVSIGEYVIVQSVEPFSATGEDVEVADLRENAHRITGKTVISSDGERVGTVGDMYFDERGGITGYEIKQGGVFANNAAILPAQYVHSVGKDAVIADRSELVDRETFEGQLGTLGAREIGAPPSLHTPDLGNERPAADLPHPIDDAQRITTPIERLDDPRRDMR